MNKKSQQHTVGAILICSLLILISASASFVVEKNNVEASNTKFVLLGYEIQASSSDFNYSKSITIDHNQVNEDMTNFPLTLNIYNDSNLHNHAVNSSGYDIAFFNSTNETQFPHQVEKWIDDETYVNATVFVNVSSVTSATDTIIYMCYGANDTDQSNTQDVWDTSIFQAVYHMNASSGAIYDSTSHNNHSTANDGSLTYRQTTHLGYSIDFDEASFTLPDLLFKSGAGFEGTCTVVAKFDTCDPSDSRTVIDLRKNIDWIPVFYRLTSNATIAYGYDGANHQRINFTGGYADTTTWHVYTSRMVAGDGVYVWYDSAFNGSLPLGNIDASVSNNRLGRDAGSSNDWLDGKIDEVRIYHENMSANWINAEHNNIVNCTDGGFYTFGAEKAQGGTPSTYSIKGLPSNRVTWSGTAGTTVYCNDTGDTNEWLEINMSINASDNVTEIRVWMDDYNDTGAFVNASNITMYVSSDNSSYGEFGAFTDGGSNLSINISTWIAGTMGINPFLGEGLTDKDASIYCIFKLTIPADSPTDVFYSAESNSFKIYIGH